MNINVTHLGEIECVLAYEGVYGDVSFDRLSVTHCKVVAYQQYTCPSIVRFNCSDLLA